MHIFHVFVHVHVYLYITVWQLLSLNCYNHGTMIESRAARSALIPGRPAANALNRDSVVGQPPTLGRHAGGTNLCVCVRVPFIWVQYLRYKHGQSHFFSSICAPQSGALIRWVWAAIATHAPIVNHDYSPVVLTMTTYYSQSSSQVVQNWHCAAVLPRC